MAIGRFSVKVGKVGKAQPHAAYIARMGQYASRLASGKLLEYSASGNLPTWAQHDPLIFWQAADANERANGSTYREYEIALPRELNPDQRCALVDDFIQQELGTKHAYQYAIHNPQAVDGGEQPHVHLMFCERLNDGIERDPDQFFKRYNAKHPERGGAEKANKAKDFSTRQTELKQLRQRWETTCNKHLAQAGSEQRIDMRSYQERGLDQVPEPKQLPSQWHKPETQAEIRELRQARRENENAQAELRQAVPDFKAEIIKLVLTKSRSPEETKTAYEAALKNERALLKSQQEAEHKRLRSLHEQLNQEQAALNAKKPPPPVQNTKTSRALKKVADTLLGGNYAEYEQSLVEANHTWERKTAALTERIKRVDQDRKALENAEGRVFQLAVEQLQAKQPQLVKDYEKALVLEREKEEQKQQREREAIAAERKAYADVLRSQHLEAINQHPVLKATQRKIESLVSGGRDRADAIESQARHIENGIIRLDQGKSRGMER